MFTKSQDVIEVKILSWFGQAFLEWRQKGYQEECAFVNKGVKEVGDVKGNEGATLYLGI